MESLLIEDSVVVTTRDIFEEEEKSLLILEPWLAKPGSDCPNGYGSTVSEDNEIS